MSNRSSVDISTKVKIVDELRTCMLSVCTEREREREFPFYLWRFRGIRSIFAFATRCVVHHRVRRLSPFVTCQIGKHSYREPAGKASFSTPSFDIIPSTYHRENSTDSTRETPDNCDSLYVAIPSPTSRYKYLLKNK